MPGDVAGAVAFGCVLALPGLLPRGPQLRPLALEPGCLLPLALHGGGGLQGDAGALSQCLTHRTMAGGICRAKFVATGHPPALLFQIPRVGFVAKDIIPQKAAQAIQAFR